MRKLVLICLILLSAVSVAHSKESVVYFNNIARPMGMGGAFSAVPDNAHNHLYNPAATTFFPDKKFTASVSFDLIRGLYFFIELYDSYEPSGDDEQIGGLVALSLILSTSQLTFGNDYIQFKINFLDQLPSKGIDGDPMHVTSLTLAYKFSGALTGFQTGVGLQLYNIANDTPDGVGFTWGLYYRPRGGRSPFSIGIFYFACDDKLPGVRTPFERLINDTFNIGASYEIFDRFTLSFDLRNISEYTHGNYLQPHIGLEKLFHMPVDHRESITLALRGGSYYDSDADAFGYSVGFEIRYNFMEKSGSSYDGVWGVLNNLGYLYVAYTMTWEDDLQPRERNHIISIGISL